MKKALKIILITIIVLIVLAGLLLWVLHSNGYSGLRTHTEPKDGQIKVACVGDSITYGHGIASWSKNNYPTQLQGILGDGYHVANFGVSGATLSSDGDLPYVSTNQYQLSLEYVPDILVLMLGTNDTKPQNWFDDIKFTLEMDKLIANYRSVNPKVKILLCTPAAAFYKDSSSQLTNFNIRPAIVLSVANGVKSYALSNMYKIEDIVDVYSLTETHPEWFSDHVHPNTEGARAMAELVAQKITKIK